MPSPVLARRLITPFRSKLLAEYAVNGFFGGITTSRATVSPMCPDASGNLVQYAANNVALVNGDSVACWPGFANICRDSRNLAGTGWSGAAGETQNETGIDGSANTAWTVEDDSAVATRGQFNDSTITSSTNTHSARIYFKKTTTASSFPAINIQFIGGSTVDVGVVVDTDNGTLTDETGKAPDDSSISSSGDWWKVTISNADNGSGNNTLRAVIYPAVNTDASGGFVASTTGTCIVDQLDVFLDTPHAIAHALSPIVTAGSSVAVDASEPYVALPALTENFAGQLRWTPSVDDQGTVWLLGNYTDANNAWGILHDGTNIIFRNRVSGSNNDATKALNYSPDTEYLIQWKHSEINGLDIAVDRVSGTNDSTTTSVTNATNTYIGQDGNDASHTIGKIRDLRHIKVAANISTAEWLAL